MSENNCKYAIFSRSQFFDSGISCSGKTKIGLFKIRMNADCPYKADDEKCKSCGDYPQ